MSTEHERHPHPPDEKDDAAAPQHAPMMHDTMCGGHAMPMPTLTGDHELVMWQQGLWAHFVNLLLGVWLVTSPSALPASDLSARLDELDRAVPVAVYCSTGYRAGIAASVLKRSGCGAVFNVPGSIVAWKAAGFEVEGSQPQ